MSRPRRGAASGLLCALSVPLIFPACSAAVAQDDGTPITPSLSYTGALSLDAALAGNADRDDSENDELVIVEPSVELEFSYAPDTRVEALLNLQLAREYALRDEEDGRGGREAQLEVDEIWVQFDDVFADGTLQLGRLSLDDEFEWLYDANLDGALLSFDHSPLTVELSVTRERRFPQELLHDEDDDSRVNNYIASAVVELLDDEDDRGRSRVLTLGAFAVARDDRTEDADDPRFFSLLATGELDSLAYRAQIGVVHGEDGSDTLRGYGFDVGGTYRFERNHDSYLLVGFAYGSGDKDPDDDTDRSFRQTGLQGNEARFGGLSKVKYYGELADPELSNLSIVSVGGGFLPTERTSVELIYHRYTLNELADELRDADIAEELGGEHEDIGDELDLIFAWEWNTGIEFDLMLAYFAPGQAFEVRDDAVLAKAAVTYDF